MKQETLKKAKELEEDIMYMETALKYWKDGRWGSWGINDSAGTFHFAFHKHYGEGSAYREDLPQWLNGPLMEVVERELNRCKAEFKTLGGEQEEINIKSGDEIPDKTKDGIQVSAVCEDERKLPKKKKRPNVLSMFYALLICLLYVALAVGLNILSHKLFGLYCELDSITFSMVFSAIWVLCYLSIKKD